MTRPPKRPYFLRLISASKGMSREKVAQKAGITPSNMWRAETGNVISEEVVVKIAEALEISLDLMYYNMGRMPPDKAELLRKDPLFFKELMDEACQEPWKLTKTKEYMDSIKQKMNAQNPEINKMLSKIKPT